MCPLSRLHAHPLIQNVARIARDLSVPVYLVGGAVRDALREVEHRQDFDFALAEGFDELVARFARENRGKIIPWDIDQKRIVFRLAGARVTVDFSRMHTSDIIQDLKQRDFTLNAMAFAVHESEVQLIDPLGGYDDLSAHCLRMCSGDAFSRDPLRMLRAVRFARQLSCVIEPQTRERMRLSSSLISRSARERIKREFFMILHESPQETSLRELHACGLLEYLFAGDEFAGLSYEAFEQGIPVIGVLESVLLQPEACLANVRHALREYLNKDFEDGVSMLSLLMFTALLCRACTLEHATGSGNGVLTVKQVRHVASRIGLGRKAQHIVCSLIEHCDRIARMAQLSALHERVKIRFALDCGEAAAGVCLFAIADSRTAESGPVSHACPQRVMEIACDVCRYVLTSPGVHEKTALLTGDDVSSELGLGAGPRIGQILNQAAQLERDGVLENRKAALLWLKKQHGHA
jgi:tRNA nucleotidyltransferase/poly(A) polymerase